jgi:hypothetical protein
VNGSAVKAHCKTAKVTHGLASDFANPPDGASSAVTSPPQPFLPKYSYVASGAISPVQGIHTLIGTSTLTMTLADPTKDQDGDILIIVGDGKSQSTISNAAGVGFNTAGASYDVLTLQNAGQVCIWLVASNGSWCLPTAAGITGTVTGLTAAIA